MRGWEILHFRAETVRTPFIVSWPNGIGTEGTLRTQPHQLTDVMSTVLEIAGAQYPTAVEGRDPLPLEGVSMLSTLREDAHDDSRLLYWEHEGNCGVRRGAWKLVKKYGLEWELYDMLADRTELNDLAAQHPAIVEELALAYDRWAERCGVIPRRLVLEIYEKRGKGLPSE